MLPGVALEAEEQIVERLIGHVCAAQSAGEAQLVPAFTLVADTLHSDVHTTSNVNKKVKSK